MTALRINKEREIKTPDMERFGFFLKPIIYRREHGFLETRGLLLLDANGVIEKTLAIDCGLTVILSSETSSLYSINPVAGKYPSATELLQKLKLGRIAQQKTSTIKQVEDEFARACKASSIDLDALDALTLVGKNSDGQPVYEMLNGRYVVDADGKKIRDVSPAKLLYALTDDSEVDADALRECINAFINSDDEFIDNESMSSFTNVVLQKPPVVYELPDSSFTPISFIQPQDISSSQFIELYDTMNTIEAENIQSSTASDDENALFNFFQSIYKRDFAKIRAYQHDLPAPIIAALGEILFHDGKKKLYSPIVGSIFMLSLFLGKKKLNNNIELNVCEPYHDTKQNLETFMNKTAGNYQDSDFNMNAFNLKDVLEPEPHDICMTFTPSENIHIGVKIPHSSHKTHSRSHQMIIESLAVRSDDGRSIFIAPVDDNNQLGSLTESSYELIAYLYQQYQSVMIFELDKSLLNPSLFKYPVRIYIIGGKTELAQDYEYQRFINDGDIPVITKPSDVYLVCSDYLNEIENEAASSVDLMSIFDIDEAIEDAEQKNGTQSTSTLSKDDVSDDAQNKETETVNDSPTDSEPSDKTTSVDDIQSDNSAKETDGEPVRPDTSTTDSTDTVRDTERSSGDSAGRTDDDSEVEPASNASSTEEGAEKSENGDDIADDTSSESAGETADVSSSNEYEDEDEHEDDELPDFDDIFGSSTNGGGILDEDSMFDGKEPVNFDQLSDV